MIESSIPMMGIIRMFTKILACRNPKLMSPSFAKTRTRIPTILEGSTNGHSTGLKGCIGMSKKIWNKFPSIHDNARAGENLHTSFIFALSK